jgi:hypothetical protein
MTEIKKCVGEYDENTEEFKQVVIDFLWENKEPVLYTSYGFFVVYDGYCLWLLENRAEAENLGEILGKFYFDFGSYYFLPIDGNEIFI